MEESRKKPPTKLICAIFGLLGLGLFITGIMQFSSSIQMLSEAETAEGEVIALERRRTERITETRGNHALHPEVRFSTNDGKKITFSSSIGSSSEFAVGDKVEVLYRPSDPENARINSFLQLWFLPIILTIIGAPLALICGLVFKFSGADMSPEALERKRARLSPEQQRQMDKVMGMLDTTRE